LIAGHLVVPRQKQQECYAREFCWIVLPLYNVESCPKLQLF
jgi:hypothetical protein